LRHHAQPLVQAECCDPSPNLPDGLHRQPLYVSTYDYVDHDGVLKLAVPITLFCCLITDTIPSMFGGRFSCSTRLCPTS
jgi:hypothetical protein